MKVTLELNENIVAGIAYDKAVQDAYNKLSEYSNDLTMMYATAFTDGVMYILELLEKDKQNGTTTDIEKRTTSNNNGN